MAMGSGLLRFLQTANKDGKILLVFQTDQHLKSFIDKNDDYIRGFINFNKRVEYLTHQALADYKSMQKKKRPTRDGEPFDWVKHDPSVPPRVRSYADATVIIDEADAFFGNA